MAVTITVVNEGTHSYGDMAVKIVKYDITSYTTGGENARPSDFGMTRIDMVKGINIGDTAGERDQYLIYDVAGEKLLVFVASTGLQAAAAATAEFRLEVIGK